MEAVSFNNLIIGFNKDAPLAENISGSACASELTILIGANGVGKSTLLRTISGQQKRIRGASLINNKEVSNIDLKEKSELISYVSTERIKPHNMRVFSYIGMGRHIYTNWLGQLSNQDNSAILKSLNITDTSHLKDKFLDELSDGEFQKVTIARAITQNTPIIILDEPTSFLDISGKYEIVLLLRKIAREENKCIILSTHNLDIAIALADKLWVFNNRKITEGAPEDLILNKTVGKLLINSGLALKTETGNIELVNKTEKECKLICKNKDYELWIIKALNKIGYSISDKGNIPIIEVGNNITYTHNSSVETFNSIYQLSKFIRLI